MKKTILFLSTILVVILVQNTLTSSASGAMGVASTGCGGGSCHTTQDAATSISIQIDGTDPSSLGGYVPGKLYSITLFVTRSSLPSKPAGFDFSISKGTLSSAPAGTTLMSTTEIHHTSAKTTSSGGTAIWDFKWTAPAAGSGIVDINIAANVTNGSGGADAGDAWNYLATPISLTEGSASSAPTIKNLKVSGVSNTTATIGATINANNLNTRDTFQFGLTTSYDSTRSPGTLITGSTDAVRSISLIGLTPNTTYHYRVKATNSAGQTVSKDTLFKTTALATPIITLVGSSNITNTSAKINATINANGTPTDTIRVYYGTSTSYTDSIAMSPSIATGTTNKVSTVTISGLTKGALYHYQVKTKNSAGSSESGDFMFTTANIGSISSIISEDFGIYPNPATDNLYITSDMKDVKQISAVSLSGKSIELDLHILNTNHVKASTKNLSSGIYYIRVKTSNGWIQNSKPITIE